MTFRDRFYTERTAKAMLSWRLPAGVAVAIVAVLLEAHWGIALVVGLAAYSGLVLLAMPRPNRTVAIDPFTVSEPWRRSVIAAQRSGRLLHETVATSADGPMKDRLAGIVERLESGLIEVWDIARRGDQIDDAVRRLDPTGLRSKLQSLERQSASSTSTELEATVGSVRAQIESAERLKALSAETTGRLRLAQTRLDELTARATEVSVGASDSETFASDVDDLVVEIESLRLAVEEVRDA